MRNIRVAAVQFQHAAGDKTANLETIERFVANSAAQQVEIVAFSECCISGYWHLRKLSREQMVAIAEPVPGGPAAQRLLALSHQHGMTIGAGLVELGQDGKLFNSYVVAMPDGSWACHRKLHVFVSEYLSPGDRYTVFDSPHGCRVGVLICYDNNIVENARITALAGAEILLAPHQTGGCRSGSPCAMGPIDVELWRNRERNPEAIRAEFMGDKGRGWLMRWLPARAHDNGMFLVFSNGVGQDDDEVRTGNAMVIDCYGRIIRESQSIGDDMVVADLDASLRERSTGVRWIKARRPELYQPLTVSTGARGIRAPFGSSTMRRNMFDLAKIQSALRQFNLDGWLIYDFRGSNLLARRVVGFRDDQMGSRRWFYYVPASGQPQKLVHRIESSALDHLPGAKAVYLRWQELEAGVAGLVAGAKRVAMEYSPRNANPYVSKVDAGTVELVRSYGIEVISSGDLVQQFEATWDDEQIAMHWEAARHTDSAYAKAWAFIAEKTRGGGSVRETEVQSLIMQHFQDNGLTTYHPPIVGANAHSGDPHFDTSPATDVAIREGDFVLIDLWAKMNRPRSVYSDLTRVGYVGDRVPEKYERVFRIVAAARDSAIAKVQEAFAAGRPLAGAEVDHAARMVIEQAGYGPQFVHRTGHSIGQEVHGNGANMDGLETREDRLVLPRTCFSIEPGIYQDEFGVRSEINVLIDGAGKVHVTGGELQRAVVPILAGV